MTQESTDNDVVVIGGGIAGMIAANRAAQLGLRAIVLEQGSDAKYRCNTRFTGGTFHVAMREITLDEQTLYDTIVKISDGFVRPELARLMARDGRRVVSWLQAEGTRFMRASASEYHRWVLAPPGRSRPGLDWEGRSGDVLLQLLESQLAKRGGKLARGTRAKTLIMDGSRCVGVVADSAGSEISYSARAMVIADGGFQSNPDLLRQYITKHPDRLKQRGGANGFGDGAKMASAAGAELVSMDCFYGHTLSKDALTNDNLWPYPYLDSLVTAGIVVDGAGRRYTDEGRGGVHVANATARLEDPLSAHVVFDAAIWDKAGRNGLIAANPHLEREGGTMHRADSIEALCALAGLPADALAQTIADYNAACSGDGLGSLSPVRTTAKAKAEPIARAPFYAVPMVAGITHTMGGIRINEHAQALRADGTAIEGLYAAGGASGGLEGGSQIAYVGGLAIGGVTGLAAAEHAAGAKNP
jgi:fumarate reductase flavoprotein subunit